MKLTFRKLNDGWNAEPNAPEPIIEVSGSDLVIQFVLNAARFPTFAEGDRGILHFAECSKYRLGATNDEGWYRGQCRYSGLAPGWGDFYELTGDDPHLPEPEDWITLGAISSISRHFLFYFRDQTFECLAADWRFEPTPSNAVVRLTAKA